nr:TRAP transporter small permease [uncultured Agrobacterium sp.]
MDETSSFFGRVIRLATDVLAGLAAVGVLAVVLLQVSTRMWGTPVSWTEEATRYLFIWMVFLGVAGSFRTADMARVTVFIALMPAFVRRLALPIYVLSSVVFFGLMVWTGWTLVRQQYVMNEAAATLATPMWMIGVIIPLSAALGIAAIVESLRQHRDRIELPEGLQPLADADLVVGNMEKRP